MNEHFDEMVANIAAVDHEDHPQWMDASRYGVASALANMDEIRGQAQRSSLPSGVIAYEFMKYALRARREYLESC